MKRGCQRRKHLSTEAPDLLASPRKPSAELVQVEARRDREFHEWMQRQCAKHLVFEQLTLFAEVA